MGLLQFAYAANRTGEFTEFIVITGKTSQPRKIATWRNHSNLHGWMESLWREKSEYNQLFTHEKELKTSFNHVELELTWNDIDDLEFAIINSELPSASGHYVSTDRDDHYYYEDLDFIKNARVELFCGLKVFYNSSW